MSDADRPSPTDANESPKEPVSQAFSATEDPSEGVAAEPVEPSQAPQEARSTAVGGKNDPVATDQATADRYRAMVAVASGENPAMLHAESSDDAFGEGRFGIAPPLSAVQPLTGADAEVAKMLERRSRRALIPDVVPSQPDHPELVDVLEKATKESQELQLFASTINSPDQAMRTLRRFDLVTVGEPALVQAVNALDEILRSKKKVPIDTIRQAFMQIAKAVPRIRKAQWIKARVEQNLADAGVDMEARARLLQERRDHFAQLKADEKKQLAAAPEVLDVEEATADRRAARAAADAAQMQRSLDAIRERGATVDRTEVERLKAAIAARPDRDEVELLSEQAKRAAGAGTAAFLTKVAALADPGALLDPAAPVTEAPQPIETEVTVAVSTTQVPIYSADRLSPLDAEGTDWRKDIPLEVLAQAKRDAAELSALADQPLSGNLALGALVRAGISHPEVLLELGLSELADLVDDTQRRKHKTPNYLSSRLLIVAARDLEEYRAAEWKLARERDKLLSAGVDMEEYDRLLEERRHKKIGRRRSERIARQLEHEARVEAERRIGLGLPVPQFDNSDVEGDEETDVGDEPTGPEDDAGLLRELAGALGNPEEASAEFLEQMTDRLFELADMIDKGEMTLNRGGGQVTMFFRARETTSGIERDEEAPIRHQISAVRSMMQLFDRELAELARRTA